MRFSIELRARASQSESIEYKHNYFMQRVTQLPPPWGIEQRNLPPVPDPRSDLIAGFNFGSFLGKGVKGHVYYQFRRPFRDEAGDDDFVDLTFNANRVDFRTLAYDVFPQFIAAFSPYVGAIAHDEFSYLDYDVRRAMNFNARHMVFRISQISFFDALLCQRAFTLSPEMIAEKLKGVVEHTLLASGGILIIGSSQPLNLTDADRLSREWCNRLKK